MDQFDIGRLTDFDFEVVCKDLLELELGLKLEIFAPGKDGGIDIRHMRSPTSEVNDIVIQCKHWDSTKFATLYSYMKNKELPKIAKLDPRRYILATSVPMSVQQKNRLLKLLAPYVKSANDVYNVHEIESLLRSNPQIVQRHMRLWLSNTATLQAMFSKNILTRSGDLADEIKNTMLVYVPNESFNRASELLADQRVCIIAGVPGIGKTTLAQILSVNYANEGYEILEISEDVEEINTVWSEQAPQFFYYDDFLGQNSLEDRLHKNEDSRLAKLIKRINKSPNKRFVLTTREYILEQARRKYERLASEDFNPLTCILTLDDYTLVIRAEILYNHLYFSSLTSAEKAQFADPAVYTPIVNHRNFNPRLIDYSLRLTVSSGDDGALSASQAMLENLNNPRRIWEHIIYYQLDQEAVDTLIVLFSFTREAMIGELETAFHSYIKQNGRSANHREFRQSLKILDNTMTRSGSNSSSNTISYHSASIRDYMSQYLAENPSELIALIRSAQTFEEVSSIAAQGAGPLRADLNQQLQQALAEIEAAVKRTWNLSNKEHKSRFERSDELAQRAADVIDIANSFSSDDLANLIADWLTDFQPKESLSDPSDLVVLLKKLWESNAPRLVAMRENLRDEVIEYLFEDLSAWDNAEYASNMLGELGDIAPSWAFDEIRERMAELTEEGLARFADYSRDEPYYPSHLSDMVDFAYEFASPDERFAGYSEAAEAVELQRARQQESQPRAHPITTEAIDADDSRISEMLGSLAEQYDR